jgi:hypothetical protein
VAELDLMKLIMLLEHGAIQRVLQEAPEAAGLKRGVLAQIERETDQLQHGVLAVCLEILP